MNGRAPSDEFRRRQLRRERGSALRRSLRAADHPLAVAWTATQPWPTPASSSASSCWARCRSWSRGAGSSRPAPVPRSGWSRCAVTSRSGPGRRGAGRRRSGSGRHPRGPDRRTFSPRRQSLVSLSVARTIYRGAHGRLAGRRRLLIVGIDDQTAEICRYHGSSRAQVRSRRGGRLAGQAEAPTSPSFGVGELDPDRRWWRWRGDSDEHQAALLNDVTRRLLEQRCQRPP